MPLNSNILKNSIRPSILEAFKTITMKGVEPNQFRKVVGDGVELDRDAYNNAKNSAESLANSIADNLSAELASALVAHIKTGLIESTIIPSTIVTVGSQSTQSGPVSPLKVIGTIS